MDAAPSTIGLAEIADGLQEGLWAVNPEGAITYANLALAALLKTKREKLVGCRAMEFVLPEDHDRAKGVFVGKTEADRELVRFRLKAADGSEVWVESRAAEIKPGHIDFAGALALVREATLDAQNTRALLASIVESSDDAIVSKDLKGTILSWNGGAERIFGYPAAEIIGKSILTLIPADRKHEEDDILARLRRGERIEHFETIRKCKNGKLIEVSVTISPIRNAAGEVIGASKVARDITLFKRQQEIIQAHLREEVAKSTAELRRVNEELEGFTYSVSHDLRAPLRAIVSSSKILMEDYGELVPGPARSELERQVIAANRLGQLIDDLLRLSRLARQPLKKAHLDLTAIAHDIVADLCDGEECPDVKIQEGMTAYGDGPSLRLVIGNLIENACKFSKYSGPVHFGHAEGKFFVRDRGIGFEKKYEHMLFLPFERLVLDSEYPGTGIGLANVKRIIQRHGGEVWAESAGLGKGATFFFSLPEKPHVDVL